MSMAAPNVLPRLIDERLGSDTTEMRGDHDLNPGWGYTSAPKRAAVLMPLVERNGSLSLLLIHRATHLSAHGGQIAFPGGRIDPGESAEEAAVREAEEEVGIKPDQVRIAGRLQPYLTRTGYLIDPFVGWIREPYDFVANPDEVRSMFELPLSVALDAKCMHRETVTFEGKERQFYSMTYDGHYIWGATAGILVSLRKTLGVPCGS
ncbi:MAG: CoA pyrophosphatase [Pseudomonadota bacterium]